LSDIGVRINSIDSGFAEEDLRTVLSGEKIPQTLYLPKVETVEHIDWFAEKLGSFMGKEYKDVNLILFTESARGLLNLQAICSRAQELSEYHLFHLDGVVFGSDDFYASIGATRSNDSREVFVARQQIVITAKAFGLQAIDIVYIDYKDLDGLREQSLEGARMGFTGKQCIHPGQVGVIHEAFSPAKERIEWAKELMTLFEEHQASGRGAFVFRGSMIDMPLLRQAQNIVSMAQAIENKGQEESQ
jgi:citrate lyase subunit beta-like protein